MRREKLSNLPIPWFLAGRGGRGCRSHSRARSAAISAARGLGFSRSGLGRGHIAGAGVIRLIKAGAFELEGRGGQRPLQNAVAFGAFLFQLITKMLNDLKPVTAVCTTICI